MRVIEDGDGQVALSEQDGVHVHAWRGRASVALVDLYYQELDGIVAVGDELFILTDTTDVEAPDAQVRQRIGNLQQAIEPRLRPLTICNVVVVQNALVRGALTSLKWLVPELGEMIFAGTFDEGLQVVREIRSHWRP